MTDKTVTIVYRFLPQYRAEFFNGLRAELQTHGINLQLVYGVGQQSGKCDERDLDWAHKVRNTEVRVLGRRLCWQPLPEWIYASDLLILMQESRIISNYYAWARAHARRKKVALWGHGINFQDHEYSAANRFKKAYSMKADWWFAYTDRIAELIAAHGFPSDRITVVNNAINTAMLQKTAARVSPGDLSDLRAALGIREGPVGLFCGGMYPEKRLGFLLRCCELIRSRMPGFEVILIGAGPDSTVVAEYAATHPWVHYLGPKFDADRVPYFLLADVFLMPGLVGLAILDSFALGVPLVTTISASHGPEIDYLENGTNGLLSNDDLDSYCSTVCSLLEDDQLRASLRRGCLESAPLYSLHNMISRFVCGVIGALESSDVRPQLSVEDRHSTPVASA